MGDKILKYFWRLVCLKDARLSESERQKYNRLVFIKIYKMINLLGEDAIVGVVAMPVVLADIGVDLAVFVVVSAKR